jgi:formate dehydrogenase subunit delta
VTGTFPPSARLANEIARQFEHKPPAEAATAIANHIKAVWDPRMKRALVDYVDAGADGLAPVAVLAANQVRTTLK